MDVARVPASFCNGRATKMTLRGGEEHLWRSTLRPWRGHCKLPTIGFWLTITKRNMRKYTGNGNKIKFPSATVEAGAWATATSAVVVKGSGAAATGSPEGYFSAL